MAGAVVAARGGIVELASGDDYGRERRKVYRRAAARVDGRRVAALVHLLRLRVRVRVRVRVRLRARLRVKLRVRARARLGLG